MSSARSRVGSDKLSIGRWKKKILIHIGIVLTGIVRKISAYARIHTFRVQERGSVKFATRRRERKFRRVCENNKKLTTGKGRVGRRRERAAASQKEARRTEGD